MKLSLKSKLSLAISAVVLFNALFIGLLGNYFTDSQFSRYIAEQQELKTGEIVSAMSQQYDIATDTWNTVYIHTLGMAALYEGYIVKVYDVKNNPVWDAESHDMSLCKQIMEEISGRMASRRPINGEFTAEIFPMKRDTDILGYVSIRFYGPYFLSENDFKFLDSLNAVLFVTVLLSILFSVLLGFFIAKRLGNPILKTADAAKQISDGNYKIRISEKSGTKETAELMLSVNHLAESLEKQERLRKQLTEDVSHELRTPISVLQSHVEAMIDGLWQPTAERLQSCYDEITRIGSLVGEIENLAKLDSGSQQLNKSKISLSGLIRKALNGFEVPIKEKKLRISVHGNCSDISADGEKISRVLINLLSNAVKYTDDGGEIDIRISETGDSSEISICDTGIGIPPDELPFIFERFYRTDKSRNRKTGGSGLGLAISRSVIEAHGGKISAENRPDRGSCFRITLPK